MDYIYVCISVNCMYFLYSCPVDRLDEEFTDMFSLIHMTKDNRFLVVVLGEHRDNVQDLFRVRTKIKIRIPTN